MMEKYRERFGNMRYSPRITTLFSVAHAVYPAYCQNAKIPQDFRLPPNHSGFTADFNALNGFLSRQPFAVRRKRFLLGARQTLTASVPTQLYAANRRLRSPMAVSNEPAMSMMLSLCPADTASSNARMDRSRRLSSTSKSGCDLTGLE